MNNKEFQNLISQKDGGGTSSIVPSTSSQSLNTPARILGSRAKSSIPMTPRSVSLASRKSGSIDFARQLAEQDNPDTSQSAAKKFRTSAPKGSKFASGYVDRAKERLREGEDGEEREREERIKVLEKQFRDEEIDRETYERLRAEVAGGDLRTTHLVRGLDFKLLERVRKGEDVFGEEPKKDGKEGKEEENPEQQGEDPEDEDPDDLLEELEAKEVKPLEKHKVEKKGQFAPTTALVPGRKRSRNQILAELKARRDARRDASKAEFESALGSKFKKIGAKPTPGTRIERDGKGREVMIITDEDGNERRKVRKVDTKAAVEERKEEFKPDENGEVLGMEVPEFYRLQQIAKQKEEEDREKDMSIFDDAGSDYDPLAGLEGSDDESESGEDGEVHTESKHAAPPESKEEGDRKAMPPPARPVQRANYFKDSKTGLISQETQSRPSLDDPAILATLRKARALDMQTRSEEEIKAAEREAKLKKMLQNSSRDDEDLDMGFGTNRLEDEADMDESSRVKLSEWGGDEDDEDGGRGGGGKTKRKRGGKKKKGDKDSFTDVMKVIERRKASDG